MKKGIKYGLIGLLAVIIAVVAGGSFYMLGFSLRPDYHNDRTLSGSYEYMFNEYPHIKPWIDSLQISDALRDTF